MVGGVLGCVVAMGRGSRVCGSYGGAVGSVVAMEGQ